MIGLNEFYIYQKIATYEMTAEGVKKFSKFTTIETERFDYDNEAEIRAWLIWSETINEWIPLNLEVLKKEHPDRYESLCEEVSEANIQRMELEEEARASDFDSTENYRLG